MKKAWLIVVTIVSSLIFSDMNAQIITTIAGTGVWGYNGDGIPASSAKLDNAARIAVDACGNVYIGDEVNNRVRKVDIVSGIITTIAGTGVAGYNGDGIPSTTAQLNAPTCLAFDNYNNLFIGDANNDRIRRVDVISGIISTYAGTGVIGFSGDGGPATSAMINAGDFAFDLIGNMYLCDYRRIRKIDITGIITTIAGTGLPGITNYGVPATSTSIHPYPAITTDIAGNIYTVDSLGTILKINTSTDILTKIAGIGTSISPYSGDGTPATICAMNPDGLYVDSIGNIYAACNSDNLCIKIDIAGITHCIAGTGSAGFSGDGGTAITSKLWLPRDLKFDHFGHMYIADWENSRIRKVTYPYTPTSPIVSLSGVVSAPVGSSVTIIAAIAGGSSNYIIYWKNHGIEFTSTTVPSVTYTKPAGIDTITALVVPLCGIYDSSTSAGHIVSTGSGIEGNVQLNNYANVQIWPNPVKDELNVYNDATLIENLSFSNLWGQEIFNHEFYNKQVQISTSRIPSGIYFVKVNGIYIGKFVKE